ncbi:30S ribosomal protein S2 [Candidatus Sumerlaeota bacterium]|nr:30S ribosomal protein S2 [Candidatus Sumerlaeota bacterium]
MQEVTMKQLLEAGVHFGHQRRRWNPKMAEYIYTERNGIFIIDLKKTVNLLREACDAIREIVARGQNVLFVGTKKQARDIIEEAARGCGMYWVNNRWLGGLLTNFRTIRKSVARYIELEKIFEDGTINQYTKKERSRLLHEKSKLEKNLIGVKNMDQLPGALYVIDTHKERIAVQEARRMRIPVVAIVDTNCDPEMVDFVIPGNDDAIRSIKLITDQIVSAIQEGLAMRSGEVVAAPAPSPEEALVIPGVDSSLEDLEEKYKEYIAEQTDVADYGVEARESVIPLPDEQTPPVEEEEISEEKQSEKEKLEEKQSEGEDTETQNPTTT